MSQEQKPEPVLVPSRRLPGVQWVCKPRPGDPTTPKSAHNRRWHDDERIDPRIRGFYRRLPFGIMAYDELWLPELDGDALAGGEALAPSAGLVVSEEGMVSWPDQNTITLSVIRPEASVAASPSSTSGTKQFPCVVYCHGGGMSHYSAFLNCFQTLGRLIAHRGLLCVLPDFRNSDVPSRVGEAAVPFPAGLNDCVSAVRWVHANAAKLSIDPSRVVIAGESGGGNLAIATALRLQWGEDGDPRDSGSSGKKTQREELPPLAGLFAACPFLSGVINLQDEKCASMRENAGIGIDFPTDLASPLYRFYGHGQDEGMKLHSEKNVFAWPGYLTKEDLQERGGLPPTAVVVNEFDPFRDEGLWFYRTCLAAGVPARCVTLNGTTHGIGTYLPGICPDVTHAVVDTIELLARSGEGGARL